MDKKNSKDSVIIHLELQDNRLLTPLFGNGNHHIAHIEELLGIEIGTRGNIITIVGDGRRAEIAHAVLKALYNRLSRGLEVGLPEIDATINFIKGNGNKELDNSEGFWDHSVAIATRKKTIHPRTPTQAAYIESIRKNDLVFGLGPAGTGKTYLAVACGVSLLLEGKVERIILSRPAVEAGEHLGFLPGDIKEKIDPYLQPLYDALRDMLPADQIMKRLAIGEIEIAPLAFMRGRTLSKAFIILDEAQNTTTGQMKMVLTRLGEDSHMVINGDLTQVDLPHGQTSGLQQAVSILEGVQGIGTTTFSTEDVVRHALVGRIIAAYDKASAIR